ncbi:hypothetical protein J2Z22_003136 [Paenibacillus forsythiae]|uniref:Uncharacterized protein n=1 Tax=Paenibacillus forsythiae TaxID=365616 RepID=A0ABU3H9S0_9BACL|nr:hypothetical protein [Paenibacillus forsythiae]MDT3427573.1 hypothetical protein [Paenibacillus forsythiae]
MSDIHDNEIISYKVNLKNHTLTLLTVGDHASETQVLFSGVLAHMFETQLEGSIIMDIQKYELEYFIRNNFDLLEKQKKSSWPLDYKTSEELYNILLSEKYIYYVVFSSYGLSGWVLAKDLEIVNICTLE